MYPGIYFNPQHQWEAGSDGVTGSAVEEKAGFLPRAAAGRGRAPRGDERLLVPASARTPCRPGTRPGDCYGQRLLEGTLCLNEPLPTLPRPHPLLPEEQPGRRLVSAEQGQGPGVTALPRS
ncbi:hypothetical protein NDU88_001711 [Pleurodeles waltl]|uniref:Uncharacterized protein n=1 Tax=Pleurodeles waltl TaxID=8319 RepID=A0AAV7WJ53_PLEWA|nr:hypothetical protein NDU88_001711 [Pleurodeles waltl]